jgi:hypothetical protein
VPKVFAWNSRVKGNPVGAEYIIMEKVPGVELESVWSSMSIEDRLSVVKDIAGYQKPWASTSFTMYGSLYYASDLGHEYQTYTLYTDDQGNEIRNSRLRLVHRLVGSLLTTSDQQSNSTEGLVRSPVCWKYTANTSSREDSRIISSRNSASRNRGC